VATPLPWSPGLFRKLTSIKMANTYPKESIYKGQFESKEVDISDIELLTELTGQN